MCKNHLLKCILLTLMLVGCTQPLSHRLPLRKVRVIEHPPIDWTINGQRLRDLGCEGKLSETCPELVALGCDEITEPRFYLGGLQPPYPVVECIHNHGEPPHKDYFRQPQGLDPRYRSFVVLQEGRYRLIIKQSEFKEIFAPVESADEAISYAMAMTSLAALFEIDPNANVDYRVDVIEETHAAETPEGYLVSLFDSDHRMGCDTHTFYAVKVLVTREGDVREVKRQEIYRFYACVDFGALTLDER